MSKKEKAANDPAKAMVTVANRQYVFKNYGLLPDFDILVADEIHSCNSESTSEFVARLKAKVKVGCSGTIPSDAYLRNKLVGMFGRVVYREDISSLQDEGFISKLMITSISVTDRAVEANRSLLFNVNSKVKYDPDDLGSDLRFDDAVKAEREYVAGHYRELYRPALEHVSGLKGNTLVLFDKIDVGSSLYEYYGELYPESSRFYNDGQTDVKEREDTRAGFEKSSDNVLFANVQILSTGVNFRRLHNIVFCFGSKSTVRVIQSIGRVLRLYGDKDYANLVDVHFNFKYSARHFGERLKMYAEHYGKRQPDKTINVAV